MDSTEKTMAKIEQALQQQGTTGAISERMAQIYAVVITLIAFSGVGFGLNALFTSLGQ